MRTIEGFAVFLKWLVLGALIGINMFRCQAARERGGNIGEELITVLWVL